MAEQTKTEGFLKPTKKKIIVTLVILAALLIPTSLFDLNHILPCNKFTNLGHETINMLGAVFSLPAKAFDTIFPSIKYYWTTPGDSLFGIIMTYVGGIIMFYLLACLICKIEKILKTGNKISIILLMLITITAFSGLIPIPSPPNQIGQNAGNYPVTLNIQSDILRIIQENDRVENFGFVCPVQGIIYNDEILEGLPLNKSQLKTYCIGKACGQQIKIDNEKIEIQNTGLTVLECSKNSYYCIVFKEYSENNFQSDYNYTKECKDTCGSA